MSSSQSQSSNDLQMNTQTHKNLLIISRSCRLHQFFIYENLYNPFDSSSLSFHLLPSFIISSTISSIISSTISSIISSMISSIISPMISSIISSMISSIISSILSCLISFIFSLDHFHAYHTPNNYVQGASDAVFAWTHVTIPQSTLYVDPHMGILGSFG